MAAFDPLPALLGGMLIGLAGALLLLLNGRIAGVSGVLGRIFAPGAGDRAWRFAFVAGLVVVGLGLRLTDAETFAFTRAPPVAVLGVAGFLVGIGTQLGNGCTSGHGVCGIGRGSMRSIAATLTFMAVAMVVVAVLR